MLSRSRNLIALLRISHGPPVCIFRRCCGTACETSPIPKSVDVKKLTLKDFLAKRQATIDAEKANPTSSPYVPNEALRADGRKGKIATVWDSEPRGNSAIFAVFFETYGCQMNVSDTEIARAVLQNVGYEEVKDVADVRIRFLFAQLTDTQFGCGGTFSGRRGLTGHLCHPRRR